MTPPLQLTALDPRYPSRLRGVPDAPASLTTAGGSLEADRVVAIVGSRVATPAAAEFAHDLASTLGRLGVVVVSGGALGIDAAAHRGTLAAGGRTWAVAGTGHGVVFPEQHAGLFDEIALGPGAMIWPFAPDYRHRSAFLARNRVLVALADAVVVVQAGFPSGALRAASCARTLGKRSWVVPASRPGNLGPPLTSTARGSCSTGAAPGPFSSSRPFSPPSAWCVPRNRRDPSHRSPAPQ